MGRAAILGLAIVMATAEAATADLVGHWEGKLEREGAALPVSFDFEPTKDGVLGRFTSLEQRAMEYPLDAPVRLVGDEVHFELGGGSLVFDGRLDGDDLRGALKDEGAAAVFALARRPAPTLPYRREDVSFKNGASTLSGSLFLPPRTRSGGRFPAVVFQHGSGPETRWGTSRFYADRFARMGLAALIYDKRGSGASTGDWRTARFEDLADDALAGVRLLAGRRDIDAGRIGLFGHSQGGLTSPLAVVRGRPGEVSFLIAADTFAGVIFEQDLYRVDHAIDRQEWSKKDKESARAFYRIFIDVARGSRPYADLERASAAVTATAWYQWLGIPPRDHWLWAWYRTTGNFDALPVWAQIRVPVLLIYGERDELVPPGESIAKIEGALHRAGNDRFLGVIIPRAAHNLTVRPEPGEPFDWWRAAPGLPTLLTGWVLATAGPSK